MTFYSGQKIVCIANVYPSPRTGIPFRLGRIKIGETYTVDRQYKSSYGLNVVLLIELPVRKFNKYKEPNGWPPDCFRPLVDKKTDISELQKLLNTENLTNDLSIEA